jgi:hypothetical protein
MKRFTHRSFTSGDFVTLPRVGVAQAIALGSRLLSAVKAEGELPDAIAEAARGMKRHHQELVDVTSRVTAKRSKADRLEAQRAATAAWGGARSWLVGWARLTESEEAEIAVRLLDILFTDGLEFIQRPSDAAWGEAARRLETLKKEGLEDSFEELGGQRFLDRIRTTHKELGRILELAQKNRNDAVRSRSRARVDALDAFRQSMRQYVLQVTAHAEHRVDGAEALADRLLIPLGEWEPQKRKKRSKATTPVAAPGSSPAPGSGPGS